MTIGKLNETIKGVAEFKISRLSDGFIYNLPKPTGFVIENGIEEKQQMTQNGQGEKARASSYIAGRMPTLSIAYSHLQPEILQFKTGQVFHTVTKNIDVIKSYRVTKTNYDAQVSGYLGFGVLEDTVTKASITRNNASVALTQQPFLTFDVNTVDSFAVGAALNVKFSTNLAIANEIVSLITIQSTTSLSIGDEFVPTLAVRAILITTLNKVIHFRADNVTVSYNGSAIDPSAEQVQIPLFFNDIPGTCFPYEWDYLPLQVGCN